MTPAAVASAPNVNAMYGSVLSVCLTYVSSAKKTYHDRGLFGLVNLMTGSFAFASILVLYVGYCEFLFVEGLHKKGLV